MAVFDAREVVRLAAVALPRAARVLPLLAREEPLLRALPLLPRALPLEPPLLLRAEPLLLLRLRELLPGERLAVPLLAACARVPDAPLLLLEVDFELRELAVRPRDVLFDFAAVPEPDPLLDDERPRADDDRLADPRGVVAAIFLTLRFVRCARKFPVLPNER